MAKAPSQRVIAEKLGISQETVSRAFRAPGTVAPALLARIHATAQALGYRRNRGASAMRSGRFGHVILVQPLDPRSTFLPDSLIAGLMDGLAEAHVSLGVARYSDAEFSDGQLLPRAVQEQAADGLLLNYATNIPAPLASLLRRHRIPAIWLNSHQNHDCVRHDDDAAGRLVTEHLLARGHRRIAWLDVHIAHDTFIHYSRSERREGYRVAMAAAGLPAQELTPAWTPLPDLAGVLAEQLVAAGDLDAIAAYGSFEAIALQHAAQRLGRRVPEDLDVAVVDSRAAFIGTPISTAILDFAALGRTAAGELLAKIAEPGRRRPVQVLPPRLVPSTHNIPRGGNP